MTYSIIHLMFTTSTTHLLHASWPITFFPCTWRWRGFIDEEAYLSASHMLRCIAAGLLIRVRGLLLQCSLMWRCFRCKCRPFWWFCYGPCCCWRSPVLHKVIYWEETSLKTTWVTWHQTSNTVSQQLACRRFLSCTCLGSHSFNVGGVFVGADGNERRKLASQSGGAARNQGDSEEAIPSSDSERAQGRLSQLLLEDFHILLATILTLIFNVKWDVYCVINERQCLTCHFIISLQSVFFFRIRMQTMIKIQFTAIYTKYLKRWRGHWKNLIDKSWQDKEF